MALTRGTKLGPYEILDSLGKGGMGEVYRAYDSKLGRDVAIKVLPDSLARDEGRLERFEREARAVAALSHPNILAIYDFGSDDARAFAVTELLEGETLRARLEPLLINPVERSELVTGKAGAVLLFTTVALVEILIGFAIVLNYFPL